jgi:hypothetical protein
MKAKTKEDSPEIRVAVIGAGHPTAHFEHPSDLIEKGRKYNALESSHEEAIKALKRIVKEHSEPHPPMGDADPYKAERLYLKQAERAIKNAEKLSK